MRNSWTDERLDEMSRRMDQGFAQIHADVKALGETTKADIRALGDETRTEIKALRRDAKAEIKALRSDTKAETRALRESTKADIRLLATEFVALQRTLVLTGGGILAALLGVLATQL